jgi:hypothetical protein
MMTRQLLLAPTTKSLDHSSLIHFYLPFLLNSFSNTFLCNTPGFPLLINVYKWQPRTPLSPTCGVICVSVQSISWASLLSCAQLRACYYKDNQMQIPTGHRAYDMFSKTWSSYEKKLNDDSSHFMHSWRRKLLASELDFNWL